MHPRLRAGGGAAGSLRSAGVWRQGSCPVAKGGPSWPAPRAGHAALSGRPPPLHRGTQDQERRAEPKLLRQGLPRSAFPRVPSRSRRAGAGKVAQRSPAGCRRVCGLYMDVLPTNPGACSRSARAWMPAHRVLEGALSLVTFFGQAKKVTRPPGRRTKKHTDVRRLSRSAPRQTTNQNGFRPSPE